MSSTHVGKDSLPARMLAAAAKFPRRPALSWREDGGARRETLTYAKLAERVARLAAGFRNLGLEKGDRVILLADNSHRWITTDLALQFLGAVDVPRGSDTLPEELDHIVRHADARAAVVGTPGLIEALGENVHELDWIVTLEGEAPGVKTFDEVLELGEGQSPGTPVPGPDDMATIVYTSGTTGVPKGVPLTHGNILHNVRTLPPIVDLVPQDRFLSILPAWHVYERAVEYVVLSIGAELVYTSRRRLKEDLISEAPTFLSAVPRVFEAIYEGVNRTFRAAPAPRRALAGFLLRRSHSLTRAVNSWRTERVIWKGRAPLRSLASTLLCGLRVLPNAPFHWLGKLLVYRKVLRATGGRLRNAISGGGAMPRHVEEFFDTVGLHVLVGYGLTETSPVLACRRPDHNLRGTIGLVLPETEVQIRSLEGEVLPTGEEGVLWFKGPQVFHGYYRDAERTEAVLKDGWFDTGDLGRQLPCGDIVFTGRAKETIVLLSGENVEPEPLEMTLLASPLIRQIMVLGQDKKHLGAIIVPDLELLSDRIGGGEPELTPGSPAERAIREEVGRLLGRRKGIRPSEHVRCVRLIGEEFCVEDGTLTPTLKMRRDRILARNRDDVEALFTEN